MRDPKPEGELKLQNIRELLQKSLEMYKNKFKVLSVIAAVPIGFNIFSDLLIYSLYNTDLRYNILFSVLLATASLISFFLWSLSVPTLFFAIQENITVKESYKRGIKVIIPYIWIYFLFSALTAGGLILLIIPGILFSIWFSQAFLVLVFEEKKGMNALLKSKFLVSENFWAIVVRFLALGTIIIGLPLLITSLLDYIIASISFGGTHSLRSSANYFFEFFTVPFVSVYSYLIYNNLSEIKKNLPYEQPSLMRKLKYVLPGILGTLAVGLSVTVWTLNIVWGRDEMPLNDSDLKLSKIEIANQEDNAFYWLAPWLGDIKDLSEKSIKYDLVSKYWSEGKVRMKESKKLYWPEDNNKVKLIDDMVNGKTWDENLAKNLLDRNQEMLADFDRAANSSYFQDPILANPDNISPAMQFFSTQEIRNIAKIGLIKSSYLFRQNKEKEAFDEAIKVVRLGHLMDSAQGTLINYLMAMAIKEMGLNQIRIMLSTSTLPPDDLKNYAIEFGELKDSGYGLAAAMKGEYLIESYYLNAMNMFYEGKLSQKEFENFSEEMKNFSYSQYNVANTAMHRNANYLFKPNQTRRLFAEDARLKVANAEKEYCNEVTETDSSQAYSLASKGPFLIFTDNPIGKIIHGISQISLTGINRKKCQENFSIAGTQILLALKAYKIEKGDLPLTLSDLTPDYLSQVPKDSFDGKLIRYSKEKNIIYSVGSDLKDSGNSSITEYNGQPDDIFYNIAY